MSRSTPSFHSARRRYWTANAVDADSAFTFYMGVASSSFGPSFGLQDVDLKNHGNNIW